MTYDVLCLSHLRWDFVYQRPQHVLGRCARTHRVVFVEEPVFDEGGARLDVSPRPEGVEVAVPHLPPGLSPEEVESVVRALVNGLVRERRMDRLLVWFYTPYALPYAADLGPELVVYDCMDHLASFRGAPATLREREEALLRWADVVFTGGQSLFEAQRTRHPNVHAFPSSIDRGHFLSARGGVADPADQAPIPGPRIGFCGVIDERLDGPLVQAVAEARPEWQLVMVGPTAKIEEHELPRAPNIHYLGGKRYAELPAYMGGWDVAMMPFARNEATRFISPTKTPEYLAAGRPVVSTSIRDVVRPYGELGLVRIADEPAAFVEAIEEALREHGPRAVEAADRFLAATSWDRTWSRMEALIEATATHRRSGRAPARISVGAGDDAVQGPRLASRGTARKGAADHG